MNPLMIANDFKTKYGFAQWIEKNIYQGKKDKVKEPVKVSGTVFKDCADAYRKLFNKELMVEDYNLATRVINVMEGYKPLDIPFKKLKDNKVNLTDEERAKVKELGAEWSDERSAIMKSLIDGEEYFTTYTHRAYNCCKTLEGAADRFHKFIKGTA